ncbi:MAG: hypothetical protein ACK2UA_17755, partial [Anaerolineae bacterium]
MEIAKTGEAELDQAIADSSLLVSLREKAPVAGGQRPLPGFYKAQLDVLIDGRPLDDPDLPDYLGR